jgi:ribonuclease Z
VFELLFLGTSAFVPTKSRAVVSTVIRCGTRTFFVDCGEGFLKQWLSAPVTLRRFPTFFFSHEHADHLLGFPGFVYSLSLANRHEQIGVHAPPRTETKLQQMVSVLDLADRPTILWKTATPGEIYDDGVVTCLAFRTDHTSESLGFIFEEKPKRRFLEDKAAELNVPTGAVRKRLAAGHAVTLDDGRLVTPDQVLGVFEHGAKIAYVSDTVYNRDLLGPIRNADCLVIEATYLSSEQELAEKHKHLTALQAAQIGAEARVERIIINHISQRYEEFDVLREARMAFRSAEVASDLWKTEVRSSNEKSTLGW